MRRAEIQNTPSLNPARGSQCVYQEVWFTLCPLQHINTLSLLLLYTKSILNSTMKFLTVLAAAAAVVPSLVSAQVPPPCTARRRINIAKSITRAFNEPDFAKSAAEINAFPLTADCPAIV